MSNRNIFIAIPVMDEPQVVTFIERLALQTWLPYMVVVCVNQPKAFWGDVDKRRTAETNVRTLRELASVGDKRRTADARTLRELTNVSGKRRTADVQTSQELAGALPFALEALDHCTVGTDEKHIGVGWARKYALDFINAIAAPDDIMFWMDADTVYPDNYIEEVLKIFEQDSKILALTAPYYHLTDGFERHQQIAALRYEIYMRAYLINLYRSKHPYAFTAIGSGIVSTVKAYRKAGGLTPVKSGEDFYFIQKLFKIGKVDAWCNTVCNPSIRASGRVFFGTGPAISKGLVNDWKSYPIYPFSLFEDICSIYKGFDRLWQQSAAVITNASATVAARAKPIICEDITEYDIAKFQANASTKEQFVKFCTEKFDALRTLQYLKSRYRQDDKTDADNLQELLAWCGQRKLCEFTDLSTLTLLQWQQIRQALFETEAHLRLIHHK